MATPVSNEDQFQAAEIWAHQPTMTVSQMQAAIDTRDNHLMLIAAGQPNLPEPIIDQLAEVNLIQILVALFSSGNVNEKVFKNCLYSTAIWQTRGYDFDDLTKQLVEYLIQTIRERKFSDEMYMSVARSDDENGWRLLKMCGKHLPAEVIYFVVSNYYNHFSYYTPGVLHDCVNVSEGALLKVLNGAHLGADYALAQHPYCTEYVFEQILDNHNNTLSYGVLENIIENPTTSAKTLYKLLGSSASDHKVRRKALARMHGISGELASLIAKIAEDSPELGLLAVHEFSAIQLREILTKISHKQYNTKLAGELASQKNLDLEAAQAICAAFALNSITDSFDFPSEMVDILIKNGSLRSRIVLAGNQRTLTAHQFLLLAADEHPKVISALLHRKDIPARILTLLACDTENSEYLATDALMLAAIRP